LSILFVKKLVYLYSAIIFPDFVLNSSMTN
jgi:hypothetical protein